MNHHIEQLEEIRWNCMPQCPYCGSKNATSVSSKQRYHCNTCNTSYSVTVGTVFHATRLDLEKWFIAVSLVLSSRGRITARQLANDLHINKDTACRISHKIQVAMHDAQQRRMLIAIADRVPLVRKETHRKADNEDE
jgi:transposase-like protein